MEVIIFCVTIGIVLNFTSFGMGLAIGRESERLDKRRCGRGNKHKHADRIDNTVASMGVDRDHIPDDKGVFSVRGSDRQDIRRNRPTSEEIERVLYNFRIGAAQCEKVVLDYLIDKEGVQDEAND